MLAQRFFQVHFAPTSKDFSSVFDRLSNQQSENKTWNLLLWRTGLQTLSSCKEFMIKFCVCAS